MTAPIAGAANWWAPWTAPRDSCRSGDRYTMRGWWNLPVGATLLFGLPVSLGMIDIVGFRSSFAVVGGMFTVLGALVIAIAKPVSIIRAGFSVRAVEVLLALGILGGVAGAMFAVWSVLPA